MILFSYLDIHKAFFIIRSMLFSEMKMKRNDCLYFTIHLNLLLGKKNPEPPPGLHTKYKGYYLTTTLERMK